MAKLLAAYRRCSQTVDMIAEVEAAAAEIADQTGLDAERRWLADARERLLPLADAWPDLEDRALVLPELAAHRTKRFKRLRAAVAEASVSLQATLIEHTGKNSPLVEFLFNDVRVASMARAKPPALAQLWADFEKRLDSSYVHRLLNEEERYSPFKAQAEEVRAAGSALKAFEAEPEPVGEEEEVAVLEALDAFLTRARIPTIQARALLEAARAARAPADAPLGPAE